MVVNEIFDLEIVIFACPNLNETFQPRKLISG